MATPTADEPPANRTRRRRRSGRRTQPAPAVEELRARSWDHHDEEITSASLWRMMRLLPAALGLVGRVAWKANKAALLTAFVAQAVSGAITAFGLLAITQVLTALFAQGPTPERVVASLPTLGLVAAVYAMRGLADAAVSAATARLTPSVLRQAERDLIVAVSKVDLAAFDVPEFYDAMTRARYRGVDQVEGAAERAIMLLGALISLLATGAMVTVLHPVLLPVLALSVVPEAWATLQSARLEYRCIIRMIETRRRFSMIMDLLAERDSAAEVRAFTAQGVLLDEHERLSGAMEAEQIRLGSQQTATTLVGRSLAGVGIMLAYTTLGWLLYSGATPLAVAGAAVVAIRTVRSSLTQAVLAVNRLFEQGLYINDYRDFIAEADRRTRPTPGVCAPRAPEMIEATDVWFSYPGAEQPALRGIELTVHKGQVIALVGENGSGKSTLAKLLAGLYLPDRGSITWDGVCLSKVDADSIAHEVAVVMQDPTRWPLTARRNVTLGRADRDDPGNRVLTQVARDAGADDVVATLSQGWESLLTKRFRDGHDLSGGQWQRLSVARALYRDAPILICDEPTAALDARAEAAVYESLRRLQTGRTVFLITHRLASVRHADQIVVLHHGEIAETGTHSELMAAGGRYAELYELQARAYRDHHHPANQDINASISA